MNADRGNASVPAFKGSYATLDMRQPLAMLAQYGAVFLEYSYHAIKRFAVLTQDYGVLFQFGRD
jgi:hypothetical protein